MFARFANICKVQSIVRFSMRSEPRTDHPRVLARVAPLLPEAFFCMGRIGDRMTTCLFLSMRPSRPPRIYGSGAEHKVRITPASNFGRSKSSGDINHATDV